MPDVFKRFLLVSTFLLLPMVGYASDASLALVPSKTSFEVGQVVKARIVLVNDNAASVNTVGTNLVFPDDLLTLVSISRDASVLGLWAEEPSMKSGRVSFAGGSTDPITVDGARILTLSFRAKKVGQATFSFENTSILIADGKGTDITLQPGNSVWTIFPVSKTKSTIGDSTPTTTSSTLSPSSGTDLSRSIFEGNVSLLSFSLALNFLLLIFVFVYILRGFWQKMR